ncbi:MAG: S9 family peptidase [Cyclobacteriaceae bacterium]|nr:S9 family peptidase [Cyclobacteriaceae bacterium]
MRAQLKITGILVLILLVAGCAPKKEFSYPQVEPPIAEKQPFEIVSKHGHKRIDDYYWLKNREDSSVIDYLKAENNYRDTILAHTKTFQEKLFAEMKGRIKEKDESVPYKLDDYFYYTRYEDGAEYPIYCRKKNSLENAEEIIANGNELGKGHEYFSFFAETSPNHNIAVLVMDTVGRRFYTIRFKDMLTGKMLPDKIDGTTGNVEWANDNKTILYGRQDPTTLRANQIFKHTIGTDPSNDAVVFEEKDETLSCGVGKTRSKKYFIIGSSRTDASVNYYLDADKASGKPILIEPLTENVNYSADHYHNKFYIRTNLDAKNYRIVEAPVATPGKTYWKDVIPHRDNIFLENYEIFKDYLALEELSEGLTKIRLLKWSDQSEHTVDFGEPTYMAGISNNPDVNSGLIQYYYQSMTTPPSTFDFDMTTHEKRLLKQREVLGGFDPALYQTERVMVKARDGVNVPVSIVYRKDKFKKDGTNPCFQYAYGSYGYSTPAFFSSTRLSLLDRGFVYAIAHIRGGQEMGGQWYEDGKMMKKKNTFTDFIDCSQYLIDNKYSASDKLFANGGSAGGLLMGAITNMAPELYKGIIADVPFVDVISTMMDETIPLTTFEWKEWGNPNIKEEYDYMLSYSPYDNVEKKNYPNLLVTTGLHDSQVQYWEPAKWVAKLRDLKTDNNLLILSTNMDAGHGGASGRFQALKEEALMYAFVFDLIGVRD